MARSAGSRPRGRLVVAAAVLVVALAVGGPFVYINYLESDAPAPFQVATGQAATASTAAAGDATGETTGGSLDGTWTAGSGSVAGYRVKEVLLGQHTEAVGRTSSAKASGKLTVHGTTRAVTVPVSVQRSGDSFKVSGSIPVTFAA